MTSTTNTPRCAHCGNDGTYDRNTGKGGALYLTVDCMWKADVGKWELMERDDESGRSFDCLKCDARTEVNGSEEACFPYGALISPPGDEPDAGDVVTTIADGLDQCVGGTGWGAEHQRAADMANAAPEMLRLLEGIAGVIDTTNEEHPAFVDSGADSIGFLCEYEPEIRALISKLKN